MAAPLLTSMCTVCKHVIGFIDDPNGSSEPGLEKGDALACKAFPAGIPPSISHDETIDHRQPFPGDGGVRFELADGVELADDEFSDLWPNLKPSLDPALKAAS